MAYKALYRVLRPGTFDELAGQEHITQTLKNQVKKGKCVHAYLFCGPRGTGKTSTARILARAMNCENNREGNPCGVCSTCMALGQESCMDIVEIDAASNTHADDVRELIEKVKYSPTEGQYKVYIIDEVHMLSNHAFNALLKTLEEPPSHAVFILATTESHKLPATIVSRCQRYDFHRFKADLIVQKLKETCDKVGVVFEEDGLWSIARAAQGGMRDALSIADQCIAFCGENITTPDVLKVLGIATGDACFVLSDHILAGDVAGVLQDVHDWVQGGGDTGVLAHELMHHIRCLLIAKTKAELTLLLDVTSHLAEAFVKQAEDAGQERLLRALERLLLLENELRGAEQPRLLLEIALIRMCQPMEEQTVSALVDRVETLEKQMSQGVIPVTKKEKIKPDVPPIQEESKAGQNIAEKPKEQVATEINIADKDVWKSVLKALKQERINLYSAASAATFEGIKGEAFLISFEPASAIFADALERNNGKAFIEQLIEKETGRKVQLSVQIGKKQEEKSPQIQSTDAAQAAISFFGRENVIIKE